MTDNNEHYWGKEMSEKYSPTYNLFYIKEPINSLSSLIAIIYILYNFRIYNTNNFLIKNLIILNLICAFVAHSTYNDLFIFLDGFTLFLPLFILFYKYKYLLEFYLFIFTYILLKYYNKDTKLLFGIILTTFFIKHRMFIHDYNLFYYGLFICCIAILCRIIDQKYQQLWYLYLHALWHIIMTIGLIFIIDSMYL